LATRTYTHEHHTRAGTGTVFTTGVHGYLWFVSGFDVNQYLNNLISLVTLN
jgi:hypothetical protein